MKIVKSFNKIMSFILVVTLIATSFNMSVFAGEAGQLRIESNASDNSFTDSYEYTKDVIDAESEACEEAEIGDKDAESENNEETNTSDETGSENTENNQKVEDVETDLSDDENGSDNGDLSDLNSESDINDDTNTENTATERNTSSIMSVSNAIDVIDLSADSDELSSVWINPAFEQYDVEGLLDSLDETANASEGHSTDNKYSINSASPEFDARTYDSAVRFVRKQMTERETQIYVTIEDNVRQGFYRTKIEETEEEKEQRQQAFKEYFESFLNSVYEYKDSSYNTNNEGDYLKLNTIGTKYDYKGQSRNGTNYIYVFRILTVYSTNIEQETKVTERVRTLLEELDVDSKTTTIDKIDTIYTYITNSSVYDYDAIEEEKIKSIVDMDLTPWSAYGLLFNSANDDEDSKKGVCQGYATLLYRMLQEAGVNCRIIAGNPKNGKNTHSWNIIKIGDVWYNADATWDTKETRTGIGHPLRPAGTANYLKCNGNFPGHDRAADYSSAEFDSSFPTSESDYPVVIPVSGPFTVSFYTGTSESTIVSQSVGAGEKVTKPSDPVRKGYIFDGWYSGTGNVYDHKWDFENDTVDRELNLKARWIEDTAPVFTLNKTGADTGAEYVSVKNGDRLEIKTVKNGASILYTLDGTDPDIISNPDNTKLYEDDIILYGNKDDIVTVKALTKYYTDGIENTSSISEIKLKFADESDDWGDDISADDRQEFIDDGKNAYDVPSSDELWTRGIKTEASYTGAAITFPQMRVYKGKKLLTSGTDYTVKYSNNTNVGTATVSISGRGNYSGSIVQNFSIKPVNIEGNAAISADDVYVSYNKKVNKSKSQIKYTSIDGKTVTLKENRDYTLAFDCTDKTSSDYDSRAFMVPGTYAVRVIGKGNFTGESGYNVIITDTPLMSKATIRNLSNQNYTGSEVKPSFDVYMGREPLVKDTDYTVEYANNIQCGTATVKITGISSKCAGCKTATFKITGTKLDSIKLTSNYTYDGNEKKPDEASEELQLFSVISKGVTVSPSCYDVTYVNNVKSGTATVIVTGKNGYEGTLKKSFSISKYEMNNSEGSRISVRVPSRVAYAKGGVAIDIYNPDDDPKNEISGYKSGSGYSSRFADMLIVKDGSTYLRPGVDFTVSYSGNKAVTDKSSYRDSNDETNNKKAVVKITGKGNYKGSISKEFSIVKKYLDQDGMKITVSDIAYNSTKSNICKPSIVITDTDGRTLKAGTDYDLITYTYVDDTDVKVKNSSAQYDDVKRNAGESVDQNDIIPAGTKIKATVYAKNDDNCNYAGSVSEIFRFVQANISGASVSIRDQVYTGKPVEISKDDIVKIRVGNTDLVKTDYEIESYTNNTAKGTAKVTLRGVGNYGGTKTVNFKITAKSMNYTVEYYGNGDDGTKTMKNSYIAYNSKVTANSFRRQYYDFAGWGWDNSHEIIETNEDVIQDKGLLRQNPSDAEIYGNTIRLYARWRLTQYQITYKLNGGTNSRLNPATYTYGGASISLNAPVRAGYEFRGWFTNSRFSTDSILSEIDSDRSGNITLYAKWEKVSEQTNEQLNDRVQEIVSQCEEALGEAYFENEYDLALLLHDKLMETATFDNTDVLISAKDVLLDGCGTDEGFAAAYKLLLSKAGIENAIASANGHSWNMANLDGTWTHIDTAADRQYADPSITGDMSKLKYMYFGLTDEQIKRIYPAFTHVNSRRCNSYNASYYIVKGDMEFFASPVRDEIFAGMATGKSSYNVPAKTKDAIKDVADVYAIIEMTVNHYLDNQLPGASVAYVYNKSNPKGSYFTVSTTAKKGGLIRVSSDTDAYNPVGTNTYYIETSGSLFCNGLTDAVNEGNVSDSQKWTFYFAKESGYYGMSGYGIDAATAGADARYYNKGEALGGYLAFDDNNELISRSDTYSSDTPYYFDINTGARKKMLLYYHGGYYAKPISSEQTSLIDSIGKYAATDLLFGSSAGYESSVIYATMSDDYPLAASKYIISTGTDSEGTQYETGEAYGGDEYLNVSGYESKRFYNPKNDYVNGSDVDSVNLSISRATDSAGRTVLKVNRAGEDIAYTIKHNKFDKYNGKYLGVTNESYTYKSASGATGTIDGIINCYDMEAYCKATYKWAIETYGAENVVLCGASSGAGLCLSLLQWAAKTDVAGSGVRDIPSDTILISPWLDASMAVADSSDKGRSGNGVDYETLCYWGKIYTRVHNGSEDPSVDVSVTGRDSSVPMNYAVDNAFASPVSKANESLDYSGLGNIVCYVGGKDACLGNAKALNARCSGKDGTTLSYVYYSNEPHGFVFGTNTHRQDVVNAIVRKMMVGK